MKMITFLKRLTLLLLSVFFSFSFFLAPMHFATAAKTDSININDSLEASVKGLNFTDTVSEKGASGLSSYLFRLIDIVFPVVVIVGVVIAFFGAYKMMASNSAEDMKSGAIIVAVGVVGILIFVSAKFIGTTLVKDVLNDGGDLVGITIASNLYDKLLMPFLKVVMYFSVAVLFVILASRVFTFLFSTEDGVKKKAIGIILRTVIGIATILLSKELVEGVFGKRAEVLNENAQNLGEMGSAMLENNFQTSYPLIYTIINWVMGLTSLVVLILIIIQTIQMILKPDDTGLVDKLKKTILYVFIGVLIIGAGYFITNVLIIDGQS